jgi:hypothetical protein
MYENFNNSADAEPALNRSTQQEQQEQQVGSSKRLTVSSRALFQRTSRHSAVEVYRYDPVDGQLRGAEADVTTWEERNTEIYRWLNDDPPPFERVQTSPLPTLTQQRQRRLHGGAAGLDDEDAGLVRMSSTVHSVAPLRWSGTDVVKTTAADREQSTREKTAHIDGHQRAQSEQCVRIKSSIAHHHHRPAGSDHGAAVRNAAIWVPPSVQATAAGKRPWPGRAAASDGGGKTGLYKARSMASLAERHSRRCIENQLLKASLYRQGIDY